MPDSPPPGQTAETDLPSGDPAELTRLLAAYMEAFPALEETHKALQREVERCQAELRRKNDELALMAERARRNERLAALGEMAAGVAHEIRNPLGGIDLYASHLERQLPEGPGRETCRKIISATARLNRIVTDMLSFTRGRPPQCRPCPIGQPARTALDAMQSLLETNGIQVTQDYTGAPGKYDMDPDLMAQAFINIIQNAAQAMPQGGLLAITAAAFARDETDPLAFETSASPESMAQGAPFPLSANEKPAGDAWIRLIFADNGPGIPEEAREKLFNPFFTLRAEGTGLGLAITHKIVRDHDGHVYARNAVPRGAFFVIELPERRRADPREPL